MSTVGEDPAARRTLRVLTYNVHSCIGIDRSLSVERVTEVIARARPDLVALQELDLGRKRTNGLDQARRIAELLTMDGHFFAPLAIEEEQFGDAILSRWPIRLVRAERLPGLRGLPARLTPEPRGALWVELDWAGTPLQCINTHLGLRARERWLQTQALLGPRWLGDERCRKPVILCGDLNAIASSRVCRKLSESLNDAQLSLYLHKPRRTFSSRYPLLRIDHVYTSADLVACRVEVPTDAIARVASDHLPVIVDLELTSATGG
ncbi:MAG: endonuclease/exonuclease/phosphatase family protein [Gammaproteobacteria bacterium]